MRLSMAKDRARATATTSRPKLLVWMAAVRVTSTAENAMNGSADTRTKISR